MRVISGHCKGSTLTAPDGIDTRPFTDRIKESVFNMLCSRDLVAGKEVVDIFAGSGCAGIEALSRGANSCTFVDSSALSEATIKQNLEKTNLTKWATVLKMTLESATRRFKQRGIKFDLAFVDPPFPMTNTMTKNDEVYKMLESLSEQISDKGVLVYREEIGKGAMHPENFLDLNKYIEKKIGRSLISIFTKSENQK